MIVGAPPRTASTRDRLAGVDLFHELSRRQRQAVARLVTEIDIAPGRELVRERHIGREFFVIVDGLAMVTRRGARIAMLGPGDHFGEIALLATRVRTASVVAATAMTLMVADRSEFRDMLDRAPILHRRLLDATRRRLLR